MKPLPRDQRHKIAAQRDRETRQDAERLERAASAIVFALLVVATVVVAAAAWHAVRG